MKKIIFSILVIATALVVSCKKEEPTQIKLDKKSISCPVTASESILSFTTNYDWTASSTVSWAKPVSSAGSAGSNTLNIKVDQADVNARTGYVIISCREKRDTVTISQGQLDKIEVVNPYILLTNAGGSFDIKVNANIEFTVQIPAGVNWLRLDQTKSYELRTVRMFCDANDTYDDREAELIVKSTDGKLNQTVTVHQSQFDKIMLKEHSVKLGCEKSTFTATVCTNIDFEVVIPSEVDWIKLNQSKGLKDYDVNFVCSENDTPDDREADIIFKSKDKAISDTLHVFQDKKLMMDLNKNEVFVKYEGGDFSVVVSSNVEYEIEMPQSEKWISRIETKGLRDDEVFFSCEKNGLYDDRSADIIFRSKEGGLTDTLTVSQTRTMKLVLNKREMKVTNEGDVFTVTVSTNVEYDVVIPETAGWITKVQTKGLRDDEVCFQCSENEKEEDRSTQIIFKSKESDIADTLSVLQSRIMVLELSKKDVSIKSEGDNFNVSVRTNVEFEVIMPESANWISIVTTKGMKEHEFNFKCNANGTYDDRTAEVIFKSKENDLADTLRVKQAQKNGLIASPETLEIEAEGGTLEIELLYNVKYQVSCDCDWMEISEKPATKGLSSKTYLVNVDKYENTETERSGQIVFTSGELKGTVTVVQSPAMGSVLTFTHTRLNSGVPVITGDNVTGTIEWGDNKSDSYSSSKTHKYSKATTHKVTISVKKSDAAEFKGITDISEIDFSDF